MPRFGLRADFKPIYGPSTLSFGTLEDQQTFKSQERRIKQKERLDLCYVVLLKAQEILNVKEDLRSAVDSSQIAAML